MNINFKVQDRNSFSKIFWKTDHVDYYGFNCKLNTID